MASYPDGNGSGAGANGAARQPPPSLPLNSPLPPPTLQHHQLPPQQTYDASTVAQANIAAAAHHGLQALQAATLGGAESPGTSPSPGPGPSVYPPLASPTPTPHSDQPFTPRNGVPAGAGSAAIRHTRLRRACDMCSSRKVKVSRPREGPDS